MQHWKLKENVGPDLNIMTLISEGGGGASGGGTSTPLKKRSASTTGGGSTPKRNAVGEGLGRLGLRLSEVVADLDGLSLTPLAVPGATSTEEGTTRPRLGSVSGVSSPSRGGDHLPLPPPPSSSALSSSSYLCPLSSHDVARSLPISAASSLASSYVHSRSPTPGPSRRASSATLPPLGPVPSPSLAATPSAPLFLDWPKLYKDRFLLDRNWDEGQPTLTVLDDHEDSVYCVQFDEHKAVSGSVRFFHFLVCQGGR